MIIDRLEYADRYVSLHPLFGAAFRYLRDVQGAVPSDGRYSLQEDDLVAIVEQTVGRGEHAHQIEHHRRYIDIQFVVSGEERIGWIPISSCGEPLEAFDSQRDIGFYRDRPLTWLTIPAGCFAIFFPEDGHAPLSGSGPVHKIVIKVAQRLEQILEDLHAELVLAAQLHPEKKAQLQESMRQVQQMIEEQLPPLESFPDRLRDLARDLEVTHPRLTHLVGRIADALAQIGI